MIDEKKLQETIDRSEIINLISKSIITRDSGFWEQLAECYHSGAEFTSSWWQGKPEDFVKAASKKLNVAREEGGEQKHVASSPWVVINGDRAVCECDISLYMRRGIGGVEMDFITWSRRIHLLAKENGEWKIWRRFAVYERDRVDAVEPGVDLSEHLDPKELAKYPKQIRLHLWRNQKHGSAPAGELCIRGTPQEDVVREKTRNWIEGK
jgi:SnoaL-like protein